jgi:hypothetical protein
MDQIVDPGTRSSVMIRKLALAAVVTSAVALPAMAQEKNTIDPSKGGPTSTMTDQVPTMKDDASKAAPGSAAAPSSTLPSATTTMKPGDSAAAPMTGGYGTNLALSDTEAKAWIGKPVYSSDDKKIGEVEAFMRGPDNKVSELHAGIGGFLGIGETHVVVKSSQVKFLTDRVVIDVPSAQAKDLPKVVTKY